METKATVGARAKLRHFQPFLNPVHWQTHMTPSKSLSLANLLRGELAERILTLCLERSGYRVKRLGIEELFGEVKYLDQERYLGLGLPMQLRNLPDLLVADPGVTRVKLIEVKFRRSFDRDAADRLYEKLAAQRRYWPDSYAVITIGEPFLPNARFHQDYIRVIPPNETELLRGPAGGRIPTDERDAMGLLWEQLPMLTKIFQLRDFEHFGEASEHRSREFWNNTDFIATAIRELGRV
jgi:hypothetical protein